MRAIIQYAAISLALLCNLSQAKYMKYEDLQDSLKGWCATVPDIPNANVQRSEITPYIAQVVCQPGYVLVGDEKLICRNATWIPNKLPQCEGKDDPPVANAGGNVTVILPEDSVTLNGNKSYDDRGIISYHWWIDDPTVTVDMKGTKSPFLQLYHLQSGEYRFKLKVVDTLGQQAIDNAIVTVRTVNHNHLCVSVPTLKYGSISWMKPGVSGFLTCNWNLVVRIDGVEYHSTHIECANGKWMNSDGHVLNRDYLECEGSNDNSDCGDPPQVPHGQAIRTGYNQVTYKCNEGYDYLANNVVLTCRDSQWVSNQPWSQNICNNKRFPFDIKTCPDPPNIVDGQWDPKVPDNIGFLSRSLLVSGTKVTYTCISDDYELLGNPVIECLDDMTWSRQQPICLKRTELDGKDFYCPSIPPIPNGRCLCNDKKNTSFCEPFYLTMQVQCTCNYGYRLAGNMLLTCSGKGSWDYYQPTCIKVDTGIVDTEDESPSSSSSANKMNTLAVVIATACSVLGILLLIMVVMIVRRRKPRPRRYHQMGIPQPYQRVHNGSFDDLDRVALIGYDAARLPTYEEAIRNNNNTTGNQQALSEVQISSEYRPLPSIPSAVRGTNAQNNDIQSINSNRHSITTMSTVNRDGISEIFGSIDTVNYSMSDASTSVTVDTLDSSVSRPSHGSGTATAGSVNSSNENISEDVPLIDSNREDSVSQGEVKEEDKDH